MADTARVIEPLTPDEYLDRERLDPIRHEYVDGVIYAMAGATERHNVISAELLSALLNHLPVRCRAFNGDLKLRIRLEVTDQFYYPDCMVFCGPGDQARHWREDPLVLGEVMSASTEDVDRGDKLVAYTTHVPTLQEYILIEQAMMRVEVYRRANGWQKEILGPDDMLRLESIAFEIQVSALYRRVEF